MSTSRSVACLVAAWSLLIVSSSAFSTSPPNNGPEVSRRQTLQNFIKGGAAVATASAFGVGAGFPQAANAVVTEETPRVVTRMGGLLVSIVVFCLRTLFVCSHLQYGAHSKKKTIPLLTPQFLLTILKMMIGTLPRRTSINQDVGTVWLEQVRWRGWCLRFEMARSCRSDGKH